MAATASARGKPRVTYAPVLEKWGTDDQHRRFRRADVDETGERVVVVAGGDPSPPTASLSPSPLPASARSKPPVTYAPVLEKRGMDDHRRRFRRADVDETGERVVVVVAGGDPSPAAASPSPSLPPVSARSKPSVTHAPVLEKWGLDDRRRRFRRADVDETGKRVVAAACGDPSQAAESPPPASPAAAGDDDGSLEELREKLMGHLREAADRMKLVGVTVSAGKEKPPAPAPAPDARPWNLRARKPARRPSPPAPAKMPAPVRMPAAEKGGRERRRAPERRKERARAVFSVELSKEEIAEDLYAMTGSLPRRRPRKRPRAVQRQLDTLFPGLWLSEITPESYKV